MVLFVSIRDFFFCALGRQKIFPGLKANFWCPAPKFHRFLLTMQRYTFFKVPPNFWPFWVKNHDFRAENRACFILALLLVAKRGLFSDSKPEYD